MSLVPQSLMGDFMEEAAGLRVSMTRIRRRVRASDYDQALWRELSRDVHTLQGMLLIVDLPQLKNLVCRLQRAVSKFKGDAVGSVQDTLNALDEVLRTLDEIKERTDSRLCSNIDESSRSVSSRSRGARVLIVDDSHTVLLFVQGALTSVGLRVTTARTPDEAIVAIDSDAPALILLDHSVGEQDGGVLRRRMNRDGVFRRTPVVIFSHQEEVVLRQIAIRWGATGYLKKTGDASEIVAVVSKHLLQCRYT